MTLGLFYLSYSAFFVTIDIDFANMVVRSIIGLSYLFLAYETFKTGYLQLKAVTYLRGQVSA